MSKSKVILLAHGSRDPQWRKVPEALLEKLRKNSGLEDIELAYLEFCSPNLEEVIFRSYKEGYRELSFLPLFIAAGAHLREDLPKILNSLERPDLKLKLLAPIGEHELFADAVSEIVKESLVKALID